MPRRLGRPSEEVPKLRAIDRACARTQRATDRVYSFLESAAKSYGTNVLVHQPGFKSLRPHQCHTDTLRGVLGGLIRGLVLGGVVDAELNSIGSTRTGASMPGQRECRQQGGSMSPQSLLIK